MRKVASNFDRSRLLSTGTVAVGLAARTWRWRWTVGSGELKRTATMTALSLGGRRQPRWHLRLRQVRSPCRLLRQFELVALSTTISRVRCEVTPGQTIPLQYSQPQAPQRNRTDMHCLVPRFNSCFLNGHTRRIISYIFCLYASSRQFTIVAVGIILAETKWRRYTRTRQVKWPVWKIHRPGSALPSPVYFFASGIVWTKNKNVTISDRLLLQWNGVAGLCFEGNNYKNGRQLFEEKVHPGDLAGGFFWPRNDLALLLRWRRYWFWLLSKMLRLID